MKVYREKELNFLCVFPWRFKRVPVLVTGTFVDVYKRQIRKTSAEVIGNIETQIHELEMERPIEDASLENIEETAMQYAHRLIEAAEDASRGNFTDSQRNLIVNFAYKMDDKDEVLGPVSYTHL